MAVKKRTAFVASVAALAGLGLLASCEKEPPGLASASLPATAPAATRPVVPADVWAVGRPYACRRAKGKITIDDKDHPEQWAHAMVIKDFKVPASNAPARAQTVARMLWDDENLYLHAVAYDTDLRATLKGPTGWLWTEDVVELFLKPPNPPDGKGGYYEFEVSPINSMIDLQIPIGRHTTFEYRVRWRSGARTAVKVKGTVENSKDTDEYYRVLMAIPWKNMEFIAGKPPREGDVWKFNIPRCDLSKGLPRNRELSACVPLPKPDFHMHELYPQIRFVK